MLGRVGGGDGVKVGGGGGGGVMVQIAAVTALGVIVQTLPKFLSSYATDIVDKVRGAALGGTIFTGGIKIAFLSVMSDSGRR